MRLGFRDYSWMLSLGTPATVGVNKTNELIVTQKAEIQKVFVYAKTAPTGTNIIIDINKNGTTIWTTQNNRLNIVVASNSGIQTLFDVTALSPGDRLTVDIDQVGSTVAGQDITIVLTC